MNPRHALPRVLRCMAALVMAAGVGSGAWALDPPHDQSRNFQCVTCHALHNSPGGTLNVVSGNANLCLTCHVPTGQAAERPLAIADEALPPEPLLTGWSVGKGTTHRWDSGPSGHVKTVTGNTSPGRVASSGTFSGRIEETYTITIVAAGQVGTATFNWASLRDGSGTGLPTGANVAIGGKNLFLNFANGTAAPSFKTGDQWTLRARTDLRLPIESVPAERPLWQRVMREQLPDLSTLGDPKVVCSTCHDQHNQRHEPFDASAPAYGGAGTGWTATGIGRHFQRQPNPNNEMCKICHSARNVTTSSAGSHPVGVAIPGGNFQTPPNLPLSDTARVECMSCHAPHYQDSGGANAGTGDGFLLRRSIGSLCFQCHTNADQANGSHFNAGTGALWGGNRNRTASAGQLLDALTATAFPKHQTGMRGACVNCHWPHGWPNAAAPAADYARLWVERYDTDRTAKTDGSNGEALCFACHTAPVGGVPATPATSNIEAEFSRGSALATANDDVFRHPVNDNEQQNGPTGLRVVECVDCHNPHKATAADRHAGVAGVNLAGATIPAGTALQQQEVCFKCHADTFNSSRSNTSNKRLDFNTTAANSGYHPVTQAGRGQSSNLANQLLGGLTTASTIRCTDCHNSSSFSGTQGKVTDSPLVTVGPHGSSFAPILRANFSRSYTTQVWSAGNGSLCFGCHSSAGLFGANSNFSDTAGPAGSKGRGNLHDYHLVTKGVTASCMSCHYDLHSNRSAANTQYCVGTSIDVCTVTDSPPANVKTHLVNFAPDVQALNYAKPRWHINTTTGVRTCDVDCHGKPMSKITYKVLTGDEASHTYP